MDGSSPPAPPVNERGETNRWLLGIIGTVGAVMVTIVVGFQAQIDERQDRVLEDISKSLARVAEAVAALDARTQIERELHERERERQRQGAS